MDFIKIGMDQEAKDFIKSFLTSSSHLDVPGLSDLVADFVPPPEEFRGLVTWANAHGQDSLGSYLLQVIIPVCMNKIRSGGALPSGPVIKLDADSDNVNVIAAQMESQMVAAMNGNQQQVQQPYQEQPEREAAPYGAAALLSQVAGLARMPQDRVFVDDTPDIMIPGMDNYVKGIERLISQEVKRRVKEEKKIFDLQLKEKEATINRLNGELNKIKAAVKGIQ